MALTPKQERFVAEYLIDLNSTQAAIRAGYSKKTAYSIGNENLSKPEIVEAIQEAQEKRSEQTLIDAAWVLKRLAEESEADVADLFDENGHLKAVREWPLIWRQGLVAGVDVQAIGDGNITLTKVKLSDRAKRLEMLGKHVFVGAFSEKHEHTGRNGGPIQTITLDMSPEEATKLYQQMVKGNLTG